MRGKLEFCRAVNDKKGDNRQSVRAFLIILWATILLSGCGERGGEVSDKENKKPPMQKASESLPYDNRPAGEEGIKNAVRGYNKTVIEANMQARLLDNVRYYAVGDQVYRVASFIEERRKNNSVMRSMLKELRFLDISDTPDSATVRTEEKWHYDYVDFTGKLVEPVKEVIYRLEYEVKRDEDGWKIVSVKESFPPELMEISPPGPLFE